MAKPIFVIVDNESSYITPLEIKFLESMGDYIDLYVITEEKYFYDFFSKPKKISVLIIDESIFTNDIYKHEIDNIFILSEKQEEGETLKLNTIKINKYTSTKEIYNKVLNASDIEFFIKGDKKETEVILVHSATGGAGKTTLALGISQALAENYKKVLYVNAENINTFQYWIKDAGALTVNTITDIFSSSENYFNNIKPYIIHSNADYIPPFVSPLISLGMEISLYQTLVREAKNSGEYDVIVVDTDSVFDLNKAFWLEFADKVITVIDSNPQAMYTTNQLIKNISVNDREKHFIICNKYINNDNTNRPESERGIYLEVNECIEFVENIYQFNITEIGRLLSIKRAALLIM